MARETNLHSAAQLQFLREEFGCIRAVQIVPIFAKDALVVLIHSQTDAAETVLICPRQHFAVVLHRHRCIKISLFVPSGKTRERVSNSRLTLFQDR